MSATALVAGSFSAGQIAVVAVVVAFSAAVTALAGFGFSLMSVPLMSLAIDLHSSVIVSTLVALFSNLVQAWLYRRHIQRELAVRLTLAAFAGMPLGYAVYTLVSDTALRLTLGAGIIVAVVVLARGVNLAHVGPGMDWGLGFVSGVLNTSISTNGPPLVFDLQSRRLDPDPFRGTVNVVFFLSGVFGLIIFLIGGKVHQPEVIAGAFAVPGLGLGFLVGLPLRRHFQAERFRVLVLVLLVASAIAAVVKAFA